MGKRELLILIAFAVVGAIAYQVTAPPPKEGTRRFTLSKLLDSWRRNGRGNSATASIIREGTVTPGRLLREVRLSASSTVSVVGEDRPDIAYSLSVQATGPDQQAARQAVADTQIKEDDLGEVLAIVVTAPASARLTTRLTLRLPARLTVRIEGPRHTDVAGTAAVYLDNIIGDTQIERIAGTVSGTHRNGVLGVTDVGGVSLTLVASKATFSQVRGTTTVNARTGETHVNAPAGPVEIDANAQTVTITEPASTVRVSGSGGDIAIERPHAEVRVDVRRANVTLTLELPTPATVLTADARIRLYMPENLPIAIDAMTSPGQIEARDFSLMAETTRDDTHLAHSFGDRARVALRNQRGDIEIARRK